MMNQEAFLMKKIKNNQNFLFTISKNYCVFLFLKKKRAKFFPNSQIFEAFSLPENNFPILLVVFVFVELK